MGISDAEAVPPDGNEPNSDQDGKRGANAAQHAEWARDVVKRSGKHNRTEPTTAVSPCVICQKCTTPDGVDPVGLAIEALDQAAAERELFELLRTQGVQGAVWEMVAIGLAEYATQVLNPWIWTGEIYKKLAERGIHPKADTDERRALAVDRDYRLEIVERTVVDALMTFQSHMRDRKGWDPCQGAMLRTFFLTACLFEFRRVFEKDLRWRRTVHNPRSPGLDGIDEMMRTGGCRASGASTDPMSAVTERLAIEEYLATLSPTDKIIVLKVAQGYTHREIADLFPDLNLTPKRIEHRLRRIRERARLNLRTNE